MNPKHTWAKGDRLVHQAKPEWGTGLVELAESATHEGTPCQRLTIRFDRAGRKTISTAFAAVKPAATDAAINRAKRPPTAPPPQQGQQPVKAPTQQPTQQPDQQPDQPEPDQIQFDPEAAQEIMAKIPDAAADPFQPLAGRIRATLDLYRFEPHGRSLMDWAAIQSGLADPLSVFTRQDLELHHQRFQVRLDQHLASLLSACRAEKLDPRPILREASPPAQRALSRINAHR